MTLNINEASQEELEALPGVGPATAEKLMKARPIADGKELEGIIPPSAWLKIREEGVEFAFGEADSDPPDNDVEGPQPRGDKLTAQDLGKLSAQELQDLTTDEARPGDLMDVLKMVRDGVKPTEVRRLIPGERLKEGAEYLCLWNMYFGPHGEARRPEDPAIQVEVVRWFRNHGMDIKFAHYGPSVQLQKIVGHGAVNLVLFEIIKEEKNVNGNGPGDEEGGD